MSPGAGDRRVVRSHRFSYRTLAAASWHAGRNSEGDTEAHASGCPLPAAAIRLNVSGGLSRDCTPSSEVGVQTCRCGACPRALPHNPEKRLGEAAERGQAAGRGAGAKGACPRPDHPPAQAGIGERPATSSAALPRARAPAARRRASPAWRERNPVARNRRAVRRDRRPTPSPGRSETAADDSWPHG